ncbi:MAG: hypothetical protein U1E14_12665 [Geminicoccaceae bacterium]
MAAPGQGKQPGRPAEAAADIEDPGACGRRQRCRQLQGRGPAADVELVDAGQVLRLELSWLLAGLQQAGPDRLDQRRALVVTAQPIRRGRSAR